MFISDTNSVPESKVKPKAHVFMLQPEDAFGSYRNELLQRVPADAFPDRLALEAGQVIEFFAPDGVRLAVL